MIKQYSGQSWRLLWPEGALRLPMTHFENNEAPANDRGCVADVSHVS